MMKRSTYVRRTAAVLAALALLVSCTRLPAPAQTDSSAMVEVTPESGDVLRPGDVVRLRIWREPDLSGDFPIDEDGIVVFPKIGVVEATQESPESLHEQILEEYRTYLRNPSITVTFLRRITIMGAVRAPGLYPVGPTMTVADALAQAGGPMPQGEPDEVELFRAGERITASITQHMQIRDLPIRSGDQLYVPERSWVSRHSGLLATFISSAFSLFIAWKF